MDFRHSFLAAAISTVGLFCQPVAADNDLFSSALMIGAEFSSSMGVLEQVCLKTEQLDPAPPRLPTTENMESFVLCEMPGGAVGLSYSDGSLVLAQLQGVGLIDGFMARRQVSEEPVRYAGRDIYPSVALAVDPAMEQAWLLSPAHLHAHLFLFDHPMLADAAPRLGEAASPVLLPVGVEIGMDLTDVRALLSVQCAVHEERRIEPATLPGGPSRQVQIDCFGVDVAGFPRKVEFVFADAALELVWILTGEEEHARLLHQLTLAFGDPTQETDSYVIWPDGLALRKDVPEIMMASPEVANALIGQE